MQIFSIPVTGTDQEVNLQQLSVLRQAFVVAGSLIWGGVALAVFVHSTFVVVPVIVGGGLLLSGLIGKCPMVAILKLAPWNRQTATSENVAKK